MLDFSVTFAITIFNIVFLAFVLRAILFKPVSKFMAERAKRVEDSIESAKAGREKAQELLEQRQAELRGAHLEAQEIIGAAREAAAAQAAKIAADGKSAAQDMIAEARRQIELERQKALALFGMEAAALVVAASSRLVQREFSGADSRRYAGMLLDELAAQPALAWAGSAQAAAAQTAARAGSGQAAPALAPQASGAAPGAQSGKR